jgi:hypothetical protein
MATFGNLGLALQLVHNIYGLVTNQRDNANGYKAQVLAGYPIEDQIVDGQLTPGISTVMRADADQYLMRIKWVSDAVVANQAGVSAALTALGLALSEANSLRTLFNSIANHTKSADLSTYAAINAEADYILANVPDWQRIY